MSSRLLRFLLLVLVCVAFLVQKNAFAESVHTKRIPNSTLDALKSNFNMSEALTIIEKSLDRASSRTYLISQQSRFRFIGTQQQAKMIRDTYSVLDLTSPIIGYSLFYYGSEGPLTIVDASVNPHEKKAWGKVSELVITALDSVSTPDGSKLYFLGIYDFDASYVLKIMIRQSQSPVGSDYVIRYVVSPP